MVTSNVMDKQAKDLLYQNVSTQEKPQHIKIGRQEVLLPNIHIYTKTWGKEKAVH